MDRHGFMASVRRERNAFRSGVLGKIEWPRAESRRLASVQAIINQPLGLTVYCWHVRLDQFARYREFKCHASALQSCPASCVRGCDGDFGRWAWRLPDRVRYHGIADLEG